MNFKIFIVILVSISVSYNGFSQRVDYNKIVLPPDATTDDFGEKLVQLAWQNNPDNEFVKNEKKIAQVNLKQANWTWLNQITATGNLNELSINQNPESNILFPRYNFGVSIPLGIFVQNPTESKIAKLNIEQADLTIKKQKLIIRNEVLKAYQNYLLAERIFKLRSDVTEDEYANFLSVEEKFETGEATLEEYKEATKLYNTELEKRITAENKVEISRLELEMLIGVPLNEVN